MIEKVTAHSTMGGICVNETLNHAASIDPSQRFPPYDGGKLASMKKMMTMRIPTALEGLVCWVLGLWAIRSLAGSNRITWTGLSYSTKGFLVIYLALLPYNPRGID